MRVMHARTHSTHTITGSGPIPQNANAFNRIGVSAIEFKSKAARSCSHMSRFIRSFSHSTQKPLGSHNNWSCFAKQSELNRWLGRTRDRHSRWCDATMSMLYYIHIYLCVDTVKITSATRTNFYLRAHGDGGGGRAQNRNEIDHIPRVKLPCLEFFIILVYFFFFDSFSSVFLFFCCCCEN